MAGIYCQRHPERAVFYRLLFYYFEKFLLEYEHRFEREYGYFRPVIKEVVEKYLDCGNPKNGFARIRCEDCGSEFLLHFSCKTRDSAPPAMPNGWRRCITSSCNLSPSKGLIQIQVWLPEECPNLREI